MAAYRVVDIVGRQRVLVGEELVRAHHEGDAPVVARLVASSDARGSRARSCLELGGAGRLGPGRRRTPRSPWPSAPPVRRSAVRRRRLAKPHQANEHRVRAFRPFGLALHGQHGIGRQIGLQARRVQRDPVGQHCAAERHQPVGRLGVRLLAQEVHQSVAPAAYLVDLGGHRAQLALGADLVEVDGQGAQQLLGHEVDGPDVRVQEAGDVALEEVGVGDVDAAQPQLHVERGRQPFVQGRVRLDDVHPAADLGQVVRVDHGLPLVGGAVDLRVLEAPGEDVLHQMVHRLDVPGLADGDPDRLVALEAHEQELVVAIAEEEREAAEDLPRPGACRVASSA